MNKEEYSNVTLSAGGEELNNQRHLETVIKNGCGIVPGMGLIWGKLTFPNICIGEILRKTEITLAAEVIAIGVLQSVAIREFRK